MYVKGKYQYTTEYWREANRRYFQRQKEKGIVQHSIMADARLWELIKKLREDYRKGLVV